MNQKTAALVAATLFAMSVVPMTSAVPSDCDPTTAGHQYCPDATILGPAGIDFKGVFDIGIGGCQTVVPGGPLNCNAGPGVIGGTKYAHDTSTCAAASASEGGCLYDVWAIQTGGVEVTGWGITVCTDRNDFANTCTNVGEDIDDFSNGYAGDVFAGEPKENKDDWAHTEFCAREDFVGGSYDGWDDFYVFVTSWADEDQIFANGDDNTGVGIGIGIFDIYVEGGAAVDEGTCLAAIDGPHPVSLYVDP